MVNKADQRINILLFPLILVALAVLGRIWQVQSGNLRDSLDRIAQYWNISIVFRNPPERGNIYDRWGQLLAGNTPIFELSADLRYVRDPQTISTVLNQILGLDIEETYALLTSAEPYNQLRYVVISNLVTPDQIASIQEVQSRLAHQAAQNKEASRSELPSLDGLIWTERMIRFYPASNLAANLLGFYSFIDSGNSKGNFGIEQYYDELLGGGAVETWLVEASNPNPPEPQNTLQGSSLMLTIDQEIQRTVENILDQAVQANGADVGLIVVIDPRSGEVLAMASSLRLNPNEYWNFPDVFDDSIPYNPAISQTYEPGSILLPFTLAIGLDSGSINQDTVFVDTGEFMLGGVSFENWNQGAWGKQKMSGCIQHGLNTCIVWIANNIGTRKFYEYLQAFGFGQITGIDLSNEASGRLKVPGDEDWFDSDLGTNSFGQGISVTPIQILMAASAFANDGQMVVPHVVRSIQKEGNQHDVGVLVAGRPITAITAAQVSEILAINLEAEASSALIPGYRIAGRSGTALIPEATGYSDSFTNTSFLGWGPMEDPRFMVLVWLERPRSSPWGSVVAAPVFHQVANKLVEILSIPPNINITGAENVSEQTPILP